MCGTWLLEQWHENGEPALRLAVGNTWERETKTRQEPLKLPRKRERRGRTLNKKKNLVEADLLGSNNEILGQV